MNFRIQEYINKNFFKEVWLSLVDYSRDRARARLIVCYRELIDQCLDDYLTIINYQRLIFVYAQQFAIIEGTKIYTAYANSVHLRFGQHLRRAVNTLLRIRQRTADLRRVLSEQGPIYREALDTFQPVFNAYDEGYNFGERGLYYDVKRNPVNHFKAFYQLSRLFEHLGLPVFSCFPLRRSWSLCCVTIDSKILCQNILGIQWSNAVDKLDYWRRTVNLDSKTLELQKGGQLRFRGTIQTDGVGVTVFKKRFDRQIRYTARFTVEYETTSYITNLTRRNHQEISGRCVAVGPGRRDMLYHVHENSTPEQPMQFRYTKQQQDKMWKTKKYRRILQDLKAQEPDAVHAEQAPSQQPSSTVSIEDFGRFLQARSEQSTVLSRFYGHTITNHDNGYLLFHKIRFSVYFNKQRVDQKFIQDLRAKFGEDAVFVMGNWFAPHARYHEPIRGLGFRKLLKKHEFQVFLIDEHKTSRCCPTCHNESLRTFRHVPNPRLYQRERYPTVVCHGLLRCTNLYCRLAMAAPDKHRLWNRDVAACLNYMHIICGLRRNGMVPHRFHRAAVAPTRHRRRVDDQEQPRTRIRLDDDSPS
ncbi:hypothetical protein RMATCC62417_17978 [Rhizopus microsporus]|nr:hypothetical protein RMATCC62417_17978 [Rhizopus microsporus]